MSGLHFSSCRWRPASLLNPDQSHQPHEPQQLVGSRLASPHKISHARLTTWPSATTPDGQFPSTKGTTHNGTRRADMASACLRIRRFGDGFDQPHVDRCSHPFPLDGLPLLGLDAIYPVVGWLRAPLHWRSPRMPSIASSVGLIKLSMCHTSSALFGSARQKPMRTANLPSSTGLQTAASTAARTAALHGPSEAVARVAGRPST